jgi:hypothetical protein
MSRQAAVVTAVGIDESGRHWCTLDKSFLRPGDRGWVGPFQLTTVKYCVDGQLLHYLKPGADPYVGESLSLTEKASQRPLPETASDDEVTELLSDDCDGDQAIMDDLNCGE